MPVCRYGDASVDVTDDEVTVFIPFAHPQGMFPGYRFLVEHMGLSPPVQACDSGYSRLIAQFIDIGGVHREHRFSQSASQFPGEHHSEFRRVVAAAFVLLGVFDEPFVDGHDPCRLGICAASASHKYIDIGKGYRMCLEKIKDNLLPEWQLVVCRRILQKQGGVMENAFREKARHIRKEAYLCGSRTRVDHQYPIRFHRLQYTMFAPP